MQIWGRGSCVSASLLGGLISPRNQDKCAGRTQAEHEPAAMHHMARTAAGSSALHTDFCGYLHITQPTEGPEKALFCIVKVSNMFSLHVEEDLMVDLKNGTFSDWNVITLYPITHILTNAGTTDNWWFNSKLKVSKWKYPPDHQHLVLPDELHGKYLFLHIKARRNHIIERSGAMRTTHKAQTPSLEIVWKIPLSILKTRLVNLSSLCQRKLISNEHLKNVVEHSHFSCQSFYPFAAVTASVFDSAQEVKYFLGSRYRIND